MNDLTLEEAIAHAEEVADYDCYNDEQMKCADEHRQLAEWLKELKRLKEAATDTDTISRQAAIDEAKEWIDAVYFEENDKRERKAIECFIGSLKNMPSAQPEDKCSECDAWNKYTNYPREPRWIPCSERLPRYDERSEYLVTDKDGRVRHCCLDPYIPETFVTVEEDMIVDAVAWRPAPEPWKGADDE